MLRKCRESGVSQTRTSLEYNDEVCYKTRSFLSLHFFNLILMPSVCMRLNCVLLLNRIEEQIFKTKSTGNV